MTAFNFDSAVVLLIRFIDGLNLFCCYVAEDIFLGDSNGDSEDDTWIFEDISDSDFE